VTGTGSLSDLLGVVQRGLKGMEVVDLSHLLEPLIPSWPTHAKYGHHLVESYTLGDVSCHYQLTMSEHTGTHFDAPLHFIGEGPYHYGIDQVPLEAVIGRALTISATSIEPCGLVSREFIASWERQHGDIQPGDVVLFHFGWDRRWGRRPEGASFLRDWPGLSREAAEYLVDKQVKVVGTDALSIDSYPSTDFPSHYTLLGNGVLIGENFANLGALPPSSLFMAFPLKIKGGSGSPIRAVAFVPRPEGHRPRRDDRQ
jgi:kynurenine formamidase